VAARSQDSTKAGTVVSPPVAAQSQDSTKAGTVVSPPVAAQSQDSAKAGTVAAQVPRLQDSARRLKVTRAQDSAPQAPADSIEGVPLYPAYPQAPVPYLVDPQGYAPTGPGDRGMATSMLDVSGARMQANEALRITREYAVEYHKKFAIPLGSFCFVLMGVALALKFPRSGIGLVIGGSLLIFLAFYVLLIGGENLADKGVVSAEVAMYAPVAIFTLAGVAAVASANREMGTARSVGLGEWLRDLFRRGTPGS
jgi:lipopolysaccharide export system permease protein